jgi:hypothetical protein
MSALIPRVARRGIDSGERLGCPLWMVERSLAWLLGCHLGVHYEWRAAPLQRFPHLACAVIAWYSSILPPLDNPVKSRRDTHILQRDRWQSITGV